MFYNVPFRAGSLFWALVWAVVGSGAFWTRYGTEDDHGYFFLLLVVINRERFPAWEGALRSLCVQQEGVTVTGARRSLKLLILWPEVEMLISDGSFLFQGIPYRSCSFRHPLSLLSVSVLSWQRPHVHMAALPLAVLILSGSYLKTDQKKWGIMGKWVWRKLRRSKNVPLYCSYPNPSPPWGVVVMWGETPCLLPSSMRAARKEGNIHGNYLIVSYPWCKDSHFILKLGECSL